MSTLTKPILFGSIGSLCLATILSFPAAAQTQNSRPAQPGSINYVEGQASLAGQTLRSSSVGAAQMEKGQTLSTQTGRVEVLLTPGVFLRVDDNSTVKMVSPNLADTEVAVDQGRAMVEATDVSKLNDIRVDEDGASARILKNGLYDFDAAHNQVRTFKGKLDVYANDQKVGLGEDRQLTLNAGEKLKAHDFNSAQYSDDFYRWSGLRSGYLAEAGTDEASLYVNGGPGWYGPGWYWDPWFDAYTFVPGDGIFYSPFGWGFYSPFAVYGSPFFYNGFYGRAHRFNDFHEPYGHGFEPRGGFRGGGFRGGFHGGGGFRGGGGFHGGGGRGHR